eukprot:NODE_1690_length_1441_cov_8.854885_g1525_i0.p1 GENE.NODE_1690_length_1441_cov_8.854885_g1525_i0~~NODE_1690_length_1441_cov_8.854885_g1525_i0.p1  ORF type:complete len:323 (-),score=28.11 NODE_1690_length_1441_cov_8.854885_g1525_i0:383-1351(-)
MGKICSKTLIRSVEARKLSASSSSCDSPCEPVWRCPAGFHSAGLSKSLWEEVIRMLISRGLARKVSRWVFSSCDDKLLLPPDPCGVVLEFSSFRSIVRLLMTQRNLAAYLPDVWECFARARVGSQELDYLCGLFLPPGSFDWKTLSLRGRPYFLLPRGHNAIHVERLTFSPDGRSVTTRSESREDTILVTDSPVPRDSAAWFAMRFSHANLTNCTTLRAAFGFTHLDNRRISWPNFIRAHSIVSFFSLDGVFRVNGRVEKVRQTWGLDDDVSVCLHYQRRAACFFVNRSCVFSMRDIAFTPGLPVYFFVRFADRELDTVRLL